MSHQTGIKANDELKKFFGKCRDGNKVRLVKISIDHEQLKLAEHKNIKHSSWEKDYDDFLIPLIEEAQPCYVLYRLDTKNATGHEWLFISWSPDTAPVRQKMLYASTKATLKQEFGTSQIKEELHGTVLSDITFNGYQKYKKAAIAPAPLTIREEELQELKRTEIKTDYSCDSKQQTLTGVVFPITDNTKQAIVNMTNGLHNYLQFKININEEIIDLVVAETLKTVDELQKKIPEDCARYHLYRFKHLYENQSVETIIFIYSMPGYNNCTIKERMLYSSCKNPLIEIITNSGINIAKKLEIDSGSELTETYLYEEIHPKKDFDRPKFAKPKGPPNRGPKRMTRSQE